MCDTYGKRLRSFMLPSLLPSIFKILFSNKIFIFFRYANIFVPYSHSLQNAWQALSEQKAVISKYPLASWKNPQVCGGWENGSNSLERSVSWKNFLFQIRGGYSCAICLDKMRLLSARCTPCGHVFHGSCLRKCLLYSNQCPLCKHELWYSIRVFSLTVRNLKPTWYIPDQLTSPSVSARIINNKLHWYQKHDSSNLHGVIKRYLIRSLTHSKLHSRPSPAMNSAGKWCKLTFNHWGR